MKNDISKSICKALIFTVLPFAIPLIFEIIPNTFINNAGKIIIVLLLFAIDTYFVFKITVRDCKELNDAKNIIDTNKRFYISRKVLDRIANCEKIKGEFIKDETNKLHYNYKENILLYNPHRYLERVCDELKTLVSDITHIDLEYVSVSFIYKYPKHYEITLSDIWSRLENEIGVTKEQGMQMEQALEMEFCYANPFMHQVFTQLREHGKRLVITSDMYLSKAFLSELLQKNGYEGYEELYVSCEYEKSKADGSLYEVVKRAYPDTDSMIHVGDNPVSDVKNAKKHGFEVFYYPNVNRNALLYRSYDMSAVVGGAYRGIVNNKLYNGTEQLPMEYEYGYIYGGLFVLGYCNFIHTYAREHGIDKLLFLSRDGDILRQAYAVLFPEEKTEYVYWSRAAATKLMARYNRYDFFRRYLYHKADGTYTLEQILKSMRLEFLLDRLLQRLPYEIYLTSGNVRQVKRFLEANWQEVTAVYDRESKAAELYYKKVLGDSRNALAVDIGWAGSGAIALDYLVQNVWKLPCSITGAIAGTNSVHNFEVDASEIFLQNGKLAAYLYAQSFNRDLWKKHDPNTDDNIFFELLLASPTPQFLGFELDEASGEVSYLFGKMDANPEGMKEIQSGILDFVRDYQKHFSGYPYLFCVSGRDAYAPILAASGNKKAYLKALKKKFEFEANVL